MKDASRMVGLIVNLHLASPQEAKNIIDIREIKDLCHLGSPHLPRIMALTATGVCFP